MGDRLGVRFGCVVAVVDRGDVRNLGVISMTKKKFRLTVVCEYEADPEHYDGMLFELLSMVPFSVKVEIIKEG